MSSVVGGHPVLARGTTSVRRRVWSAMARNAGDAPPVWPVLRRYDQQHLARISLPIGGLGTGTVGLGGRGDLRDFEIANRPAKGFRPDTAFFAIRVRSGDGPPRGRVLEGPLAPGDFESSWGSTAYHHGLPRF